MKCFFKSLLNVEGNMMPRVETCSFVIFGMKCFENMVQSTEKDCFWCEQVQYNTIARYFSYFFYNFFLITYAHSRDPASFFSLSCAIFFRGLLLLCSFLFSSWLRCRFLLRSSSAGWLAIPRLRAWARRTWRLYSRLSTLITPVSMCNYTACRVSYTLTCWLRIWPFSNYSFSPRLGSFLAISFFVKKMKNWNLETSKRQPLGNRKFSPRRWRVKRRAILSVASLRECWTLKNWVMGWSAWYSQMKKIMK